MTREEVITSLTKELEEANKAWSNSIHKSTALEQLRELATNAKNELVKARLEKDDGLQAFWTGQLLAYSKAALIVLDISEV